MIRRDFYTGLFLLLAGALLLAGYLYSSLTHFSRNIDIYYADGTDIAGLEEGSDVEMGGYKLGIVKRIHVRHDPALKFELELAVKKEIPILKGTRAVAASRSLTGGRFLDLRPPATGRTLLEPRSHFQIEIEPGLQGILSKADRAFANLTQITAEVEKLVASDSDHPGLKDTFARLSRALADADTAANAASRWIARLDRTTEQLAPSLTGTMQSAQSAAQRLDHLLEKEEPALDELLKQGNARLAELKTLSVVLAGYDAENNPAIRGTLEHLNGATRSLEDLLADLKSHPWKLVWKGKERPVPTPRSAASVVTPPASVRSPGGER